MKFIILLISLLLQRETRKKDYQRDRSWFVTFTNVFELKEAEIKKQVAGYVITVVLPALCLALLIHFMSGMIWGTLAFILQIALFLYVLGRDDVTQRFAEYRNCWKNKDFQGAYHCAQRDIGIEEDIAHPSVVRKRTTNEESDSAEATIETSKNIESLCINDPQKLHKKVCETVILAWFTRFFVLVFWFVVGGVPLALICLLSYWYAQEYKWPWTQSLTSAIEWIPARLLALTFALAGDFSSKFASALKYIVDMNADAQHLVVDTALPDSMQDEADSAAFDEAMADEQLKELNQMMYRSAMIWLILIGMFTLFGSLS